MDPAKRFFPLPAFLLGLSLGVQIQPLEAAEPYGFKTLVLGSSRQAILSDERFRNCVNISVDSVIGCLHVPKKETIAGAPIAIMQLDYYEDRLFKIRLTVRSIDFGAITEALIAKHGKPYSDQQTQMAMGTGATYSTRVVVWRNTLSSIEVYQRWVAWDASEIVFSLNGVEKRERAIEKSRAMKSSKDL